MRWKQFLLPVTSMDTEEAKTYLKEHKEGTFTLRKNQNTRRSADSISGARKSPGGARLKETDYRILSCGWPQPCRCAAVSGSGVQ